MPRIPLLSRFSRDSEIARALLAQVNDRVKHPLSLMEVCGTHTMAISSSGIRKAIDPRVRLLSGPGCPVCVTAQPDLDLAIALARLPEVILTTFGDMLRVPGTESTLEREAAQGRDVRVVYSPLDAVELARTEPGRLVVFLGVGFETTAPTVAGAVRHAADRQLDNFLVLPLLKTMPNALRALAESPRLKVDGFILPGHVSTIIGSRPYEFLAQEFGKPCCIVGFELLDILQGILMLLEQLRSRPAVEIQYRRSVQPEGNPTAQRLLAEVFRPADADWRGLGRIPLSGLEFSPEYARFDVRTRVRVTTPTPRPVPGCRCSDVLLGLIIPPECRRFSRNCTPENPLGPCMVSSEGACAAWYKYER